MESGLSTLDDKIDNGGGCDFISLPRDVITCLSTCNHKNNTGHIISFMAVKDASGINYLDNVV